MIDVNSFIFGMMIMAVLIGIVKQVSNITQYVIDATYKNYTVVTCDKNGEKITTKYTRNRYTSVFSGERKK